jgi:hypothetical protein
VTTIYVKNGTPQESQSKCSSCQHAHILRGFRESEEAVYCASRWGKLLVVPFKVYECSSYMDRTRPTWEQMEELAIDILPLSSTSAKPAGFRTKRDSDSSEVKRESKGEPVTTGSVK